MMIFGKPLSAYVSFAKVFLILTPLVGFLRLGLSLQGAPKSSVQWASMTALGFIGMLYFAIRVHTTGFGAYQQLLVLVTLQNLLAQLVSIVAILLSIFTGVENIFSAPEFSFGGGNQLLHLLSHAFVGTTLGSLFTWLIGCLILKITRKVARHPQTA